MMRVRGTILHRTPTLLLSTEVMALFEYAARAWPDKYGCSADFSEDLGRFLDDCAVSLFKLYGITPVVFRGTVPAWSPVVKR